LWIHLYASSVDSADDARAAMAALPRFQPLPPYKPQVPADAYIGKALFLGGRTEEAMPYLERGAKACYAMRFPIVHTQAQYWLARARESKGDVAGACAAYDKVIERWGAAKPRSLTAEKSRDRQRELGCAKPAVAPR
jgi:serine/threonine-protein kinase